MDPAVKAQRQLETIEEQIAELEAKAGADGDVTCAPQVLDEGRLVAALTPVREGEVLRQIPIEDARRTTELLLRYS